MNLFTLGFMTNSAFVPAVTLVSSPGGKTLGNVSIRHLVACSVLFQCQ